MRVRVWMFFAAGVSAILTAGCGSVVESTEEAHPPPSGSEMKGVAYWLPKAAIMIDGKWDKDNSDWTITVTPYIDADTTRHYRLTRKVNHLFEDNVTLEVDATTGLLQTVNATSEDKTAAIVAEGLAIAAKAMSFGAAGAGVAVTTRGYTKERTPAPAPCGDTVPFEGSFRYIIRSSDLPSDERYTFTRTLVLSPPPTPSPTPTPTPTSAPLGSAIGVTADSKSITKTYCIVVKREDKHDKDEIAKSIPNPTDGIVVRAPAPYRITMTQLDMKTNTERVAEQLIFLPDTQRDYLLPLDRSPFVKNDTQITLVKGVVQKVTVSRPSIILGILGVPKTILDALVPLPH
jgi:hypothetical protein